MIKSEWMKWRMGKKIACADPLPCLFFKKEAQK
jgi:hypothetical protein